MFKPGCTGWDGSSTTGEVLGLWRQAAKTAGLDKQIKASHGCFDNDVATISRTLERITGSKPKLPVDDLLGF